MSPKQNPISGVKRSFGSRVRRGMLRLLWRFWAGALILVLLLLVALTGYQMWRGGLYLSLSLLPQLVTNLILIAAVLAVRHVIHLWQTGAITQAMLESLGQGQAVLKDKMEVAKGALSSLTDEVKENLEMLVGTDSSHDAPFTTGALHCISCGRPVNTGARFCDACGAALFRACAKCGQSLRLQAKFCDGCGTPVGPKQ